MIKGIIVSEISLSGPVSSIQHIANGVGVIGTFAGQCGTPGFLDGPLGVNLLQNPTTIGVDDAGNVFVHDFGNAYIRMINQTGGFQFDFANLLGYMSTLIDGACNVTSAEVNLGRNQMLNDQTVRCYKNWTKVYGQPSNYHWDPSMAITNCYLHDILCGNRIHPLIYQNETFKPNLSSTTEG